MGVSLKFIRDYLKKRPHMVTPALVAALKAPAKKPLPTVNRADDLVGYIRTMDPRLLDGMVREHKFDDERRWKFDLAWPEIRLAVEVNGGRYCYGGGRHAGQEDNDKMLEARRAGWVVWEITTDALRRDPCGIVARLRGLIESPRK